MVSLSPAVFTDKSLKVDRDNKEIYLGATKRSAH